MKKLFTPYLFLLGILFFGYEGSFGQTIQLNAPIGGEVWQGGTTQLITWNYANIDAIKIEYSINNGLNWILIDSSYPASALSYSFRVPCFGTSKAKVRLTNTLGFTQSESNAVFTIPEATVHLTYPIGGEVYGGGTGQYITWATTHTTTLALEYTIDSGATWTSIGSFPAANGYCNWVTPATASKRMRIRGYNMEKPIDRDSTPLLFSVYNLPTINAAKYTGGQYDGYKMCSSLPDTIKVLSPIGGEVLNPTAIFPITWSYRNIDRVNILYSTDKGSTWNLIDSNIEASTQTYPWTVPNLPSTQCLIKIVATDRSLSDKSNNLFTINSAFVQLVYPSGGETFGAGTGQYIQWTANSVTTVKLEYSTNNGSTWTTIGTASASDQYANWIPPATIGNQYLLRISDNTKPSLRDSTKSNFSVFALPSIDNTKYHGGSYDGYSMANSYADSIKVTSPTGGELWQSASTQTISWTYNHIGNVAIEYSLDDGSTWNSIATNIPASQLSYSWTIPTTPSNTCRVRVKDITRDLSSMNDSAFIIPTTFLQLVYPNGGETFGVGTGQYIEWDYANLQTIKLEYSTDSGATWLTIGTANAADKYSNWVVPSNVTSNLLIRATDIVNSNYTDQSNTVFSSYSIPTIDATKFQGGSFDGYSMYSFFDSYLQIRKPNGGEVWGNGTTQKIQWAKLNNKENIILDYTTDNGATWTTLLNNVSDTPNTYNWLISSKVSSTCKVRARTVSGSLIDLSDNFFTIANPNGIVTSAITGNSFCSGQTSTVNFTLNKTTFNANNNFIVQLSDSAGTFAGAVENIGQISGTTPQSIPITFPARHYQSSAYRLRVIGTSPPTIGTDNGTNFTIRQLPNVNLGNDTTICLGSSLVLNATNLSSTYLWNNGATTPTLSVNKAGSYSVQVTNSCGSTNDTIVVGILSVPTVNLGVDTAICSNTSLTLNAGNIGAGYQWSTGSVSRTINVVTSGSYAVAVSNKCGIGRDTIKITNVPSIHVNFGLDTAICTGQSITLDAGNVGVKGIGYLWSSGQISHSITTSKPGSYWVNVRNGCSTISGQITIINGSFKVNIKGDTSICKGASANLNAIGGNSYVWNNGKAVSSFSVTPDTTTTYTVTSKNFYGCTATATKTVRVNDLPVVNTLRVYGKSSYCVGDSALLSVYAILTDEASPALTYQWMKDGILIPNANNTIYRADSSGVYDYRITDINKCTAQSNTVAIQFNPLPPAAITAVGATNICPSSNVLLNANVATGLSYQWQKNGGVITGAGAANYYASDSGAYRVVVTDTRTSCSNNSNKIAVTNRLASTSSQTVKVSGSYSWHNNTYTKSGTYTFDTINSAGCDSLVTLNLTITTTCIPTSATINQYVCGSYTWHGITYNKSGTYTFDSLNVGGCDSLTTLQLTVKQTSSSITNASICSGGSYTFNGSTYTKAGSYTTHLLNTAGCDSAATLNLSVKATSTSTTNASICAGGSYTFNGTAYTKAGSYIVHLKNSIGCDSAATLNLSVKTTSASTTNASICAGGSYTFNGTTYTTAGTYVAHLTNSAGCDSATTLNLTVKALSTSTTNASICAGGSFNFNGTIYTKSGSYVAHLTNAVGCDSAATLNLSVKATSTSTTNASICAGGSYLFNGTSYSKAGTYVAHLNNAVNCDSAATLYLSIKSTSSSITKATIIQGNSYTFNGTVYTTAGSYVAHLTNSVGCDSAATLILFVTPSSYTISGNIKNPTGSIIPNVTVNINGNQTLTTDVNGNYSYTAIANSSNIIMPSKNNDKIIANGVNGTDISLIQSHILKKVILNSPYKLIAADVNNDGAVNGTDIALIKSLILKHITQFTGNRLWTFVDSSYSFSVPSNPFPYHDSISISNVSTNQKGINFIGVKLGDVNYDWDAAVFGNSNRVNPIELFNDNISVNSAATLVRIPIKVKNFKNIMGMQYTLNFNSDVLKLKSVENNQLGVDYNMDFAGDGKLPFLWVDGANQPRSLEDSTVLFELVFNKMRDLTNENISISSDITSINAFDGNYSTVDILKVGGAITESGLNSNQFVVYPNPAKDAIVVKGTHIKEVLVIDYLGKIVKLMSLKDATNPIVQVGTLNTGLYQLRIHTLNGKMISLGFLKE